MSDILADYCEWRSKQKERIGTHSDRCHLWPSHERCMIHRLAKEVERLRLTEAEREAVERAANWMVQLAKDRGEIHSAGYFVDDAATLRGLLERMG